jgi:acid phosphatase (class A)
MCQKLRYERADDMMARIWLAAAMLAAPVVAQPATAPAPQPMGNAAMAGAPAGYLAGTRTPLDVLRLLPPPPAPGSAAERADQLIYKDSKRDIGGPLWQKAITQLSVTAPAFRQQLACALGADLGATSATNALLAKVGADIAPPIGLTKAHFKRPRPFTTDKGQACDPAAADGKGAALGFAYPSGHAAIGWLWGMVLADVRPERTAALLAFGQDTGDLRLACRVHWRSDVERGRLLATALYQRIAATPEYQADVAKARGELALAPVPAGCGG